MRGWDRVDAECEALARLERIADRLETPRSQEEVTEAMVDAATDAFDEAIDKAKADRRARNDEHEAAGRGRPCAEEAIFPIDWIEPVYRAMLAARLEKDNG
jgi:hypothetical protein